MHDDTEKTKAQLIAELRSLRTQLEGQRRLAGRPADTRLDAPAATGGRRTRPAAAERSQRVETATKSAVTRRRPRQQYDASPDLTQFIAMNLGEGVYALDRDGH